MDLDSFLISILFDNQKTAESAKKIEDVVSSLKNKIIGAFSAIASIDFLKNAVESSVKLATKLDNLSYMTNISKENLNAWGEAVQRNGGTVEGFYTSVSNLSDKIRELQTNFGGPATAAFQKLHVNLLNSNGQIKNAVELLGDLGDKFKSLPKVWQLNIGQQLGLDPATIRLLSQGNEETQKLVANMAKLGQLNSLNTEKNIKLRNSFYDISLVFESIKIKIANDLIPLVQKFSELFLKALQFLQEHSTAVKVVLLILSSLLTGIVLSSLLAVTRAIIAMTIAMATNPIVLLTVALILLGLTIQDFTVWLRGGNAEFAKFYEFFTKKSLKEKIGQFGDYLKEKIGGVFDYLLDKYKKIKELFLYFTSSSDEYEKYLEDEESQKKKKTENKSIKDMIKDTAISLGYDPNVAASIANIESGLDPSASNSLSSASGLFQLTDATANANGISDLSKKNNIAQNISAGISNLKNITNGLAKFLGHSPTGGEIYLGEHLGLEGAKTLFSSDSKTMLSQLFSPSVLKANPQFKNMTSGQLINNANKTFEQKSVTVGDVTINAPNSNAQEISKKIGGVLQQHLSSLVTNIDNGVRA